MSYDNMMPGDNSGAEPAECRRDCATNCEYADGETVDEDGRCPNDHDPAHECDCYDWIPDDY